MRKRNHVIPVRLNAREVRELNEQVERSGLSREEFMRSLILGAQVHAKPCEHHPGIAPKDCRLMQQCQSACTCCQCFWYGKRAEYSGNAAAYQRDMASGKGRVVMTDGLYKCYPRPPPGPFHRICERQRKTTQKADFEAAIDYAMNRTKTEQAVFEDTIGCTNENAYADMVATKRDSIRWAVWKDTIWYRVLQKVR